MIDGSHYGARASAGQERTLRLWIETGAPYPGTYAALGTGMIGGYAQNTQVHTDFDWPATREAGAAIDRPERSILILAPLAAGTGGLGICTNATGAAVFADARDADYRALLAQSEAGREALVRMKRLDMPGFQPRPEWVREMRRYGVLPGATDAPAPELSGADCYGIEQDYWRSLWPTAEVLASGP